MQSISSSLHSGGKRILFIDRDGTLIMEAPPAYQIDNWEKLQFYPYVFQYLSRIASELDYELIMVSNQDGLGTETFPENTFFPIQNFIVKSFGNEGVHFSAFHFDRTFPKDNASSRKPGVGMLTAYLNNKNYDIANSYVIGDRITDVQLAKNLGCKAIWINNNSGLGGSEVKDSLKELEKVTVLKTTSWKEIYEFLKLEVPKVV